jgi:hypothetical protein
VRWPLCWALRPNSRTVTEVTVMLLVDASRAVRKRAAGESLPRSASRTDKRFAESEDSRLARRPLPLWPARRLCRPQRPKGAGCAEAKQRARVVRRSEAWARGCGPLHVSSGEDCVNSRFTRPEVWPTPAGRTGQDRMVIAETIAGTVARVLRVAAQVSCDPVVVGPRTRKSVRLADRSRHNRPV